MNIGEGERAGGQKKGRLKSGEGKGAQSGVKRKHEKASVAGKGKGKGGRSGKNARPPGASDDEIAELSPSEVAQAGIRRVKEHWKEEDKEILVSYIVDSDRWMNFKVNQSKIFKHVSAFGVVHCRFGNNMVIWQIADLLLPRKSAEQIRRQWYRLWDCYKACRRREEHTGGGMVMQWMSLRWSLYHLRERLRQRVRRREGIQSMQGR